MELSSRLKTLRKQRKITLKQASERCGCSFQYLQKLESGLAIRPAIDLLYKLAAFYQFSSDILILEAGKVPQDVYYEIVRCPELLELIRNHKR